MGLLVPTGDIRADAEKVHREAHERAGLELSAEVHATDILRTHPDAYRTLIAHVVDQVSTMRGRPTMRWQPVRLVNSVHLGFGDVLQNHTNMVAELVTRIFERLHQTANCPIAIGLVVEAYRVLGTDNHEDFVIEPEEYRRRLDERIALAILRRGQAQSSSTWSISRITLGGKRWRELQLCDLLSHASFNQFRNCPMSHRPRFQAMLKNFDFKLAVQPELVQIDEALEQCDFASAVKALAIASALGRSSDTDAFLERRRAVEDALTRTNAPARAPHFQIILSWLEQLIDIQRRADMGRALSQWILKELVPSLQNRLREIERSTLLWFELGLQRLILTASNHLGDLQTGRMACTTVDKLLPRIAGQWDHISIMMEALVAQGVHLTDSFEHEEVIRRLAMVAQYYQDLGSLLCDAMPSVFPERVRCNLRGKALGTALQAQTFAAIDEPEQLDHARKLSDEAIDEFCTPGDKERQYQYRAHLETIAQCFKDARGWLAKGLKSSDADHASIGGAIATLTSFDKGFYLLHWLRLGAEIHLARNLREATAFDAAWQSSRLGTSPWLTADSMYYPAHGIRRRAAIISAKRGDENAALSAVGRLRALSKDTSASLTMYLIEAATQIEIAALLGLNGQPARRLLDDSEPGRRGASQLVQLMMREWTASLPGIQRLLEPWPDAISAALVAKKAERGSHARTLLRLARRIPY
ncbi:MAG: hypothetical protein MJE77_39505 [Proteobacteria bacterium]|nr:hypothetical protein [Pseudomonadota bacterium]